MWKGWRYMYVCTSCIPVCSHIFSHTHTQISRRQYLTSRHRFLHPTDIAAHLDAPASTSCNGTHPPYLTLSRICLCHMNTATHRHKKWWLRTGSHDTPTIFDVVKEQSMSPAQYYTINNQSDVPVCPQCMDHTLWVMNTATHRHKKWWLQTGSHDI